MRFLEQGSDIPDELISAVTNGSATFLCGAGVSFRVNLPSFKELTEGLYARLGESPNDEPAERNAIASKNMTGRCAPWRSAPTVQERHRACATR